MDQQATSRSITPEQKARIKEALQAAPAQMTLVLARQLGVPEVEILRAMPADRAAELDIHRWEELFHAFQDWGELHVIVSNGAITCEVVGHFGGFSTWGEFFNVQTPTLDLHIRPAQLAAVFAVQKPSHISGINTLSIQFFDREGMAALKVFLTFGTEARPEQVAAFACLQQTFAKETTHLA